MTAPVCTIWKWCPCDTQECLTDSIQILWGITHGKVIISIQNWHHQCAQSDTLLSTPMNCMQNGTFTVCFLILFIEWYTCYMKYIGNSLLLSIYFFKIIFSLINWKTTEPAMVWKLKKKLVQYPNNVHAFFTSYWAHRYYIPKLFTFEKSQLHREDMPQVSSQFS